MLTMKEIARLSGVSRATVSAVLNGKPGVGEKSRNKVLAVLREHDIPSRRISQSLLGQFSRLIMTVVRDINNPYFTMFIDGVIRVMREQGFHMLYHSTQESREEEVRALAAFRSYHYAGMIIFPVEENEHHDHIREVIEARKPLVTIGAVPGIETHRIDVDHRRGSKMATDYLIARGHRRIACLAGPPKSPPTKERVLGYVEGMLDHHLDFHESMVVRAGSSSEDGYAAARAIMMYPVESRPTAVLCFNDLVAIGAYRAAHELRLRIPQDISIVGFDDIDIAAVLGPPLTTVATRSREMGSMAAEMLLAQVFGDTKQGDCQNKVLEPALIERASVGSLQTRTV